MVSTTPGPGPAFYVDTETTRFRRPYREGGRRIWEIGGTRVNPDDAEYGIHAFIRIADLGLDELIDPRQLMEWEIGLWPDDKLHADGTVTGGHGQRVDLHGGTWYDYLPEDVKVSLDIGGFHERHPERGGNETHLLYAAKDIAAKLVVGPWLTPWPVTDGEEPKILKPTIVGTVPGFEDLGFDQLLTDTDTIVPDEELWSYRLVDASTYAAGALGWDFPYDPTALTEALGVDISDLEMHTAVDDATWARRLYAAARVYMRAH